MNTTSAAPSGVSRASGTDRRPAGRLSRAVVLVLLLFFLRFEDIDRAESLTRWYHTDTNGGHGKGEIAPTRCATGQRRVRVTGLPTLEHDKETKSDMLEVTIGIDIGGTNTEYGLVSRDGCCLGDGRVSTTAFDEPEGFVRALAESISQCRDGLTKDTTFVGIGIGAPNGNYYRGTIEHAPNLRWQGVVHLRDLFLERYDLPVVVTNDANAAAIGEMMYGATRGQRDFLVVTLGTGVGSGFVSNGRLIYGHDGFAGELGHTIVEENGRPCGCGRRGCLETYASGEER